MTPVQFNLPTLVTLTAPTCAGKSYLLEAMVSKLGFGRIVSTTDRFPRDGEKEGLHYFFISTAQSEMKEKMGLYAELITYNGTRYGVTHEEMDRKLAPGMAPPIVILEPQGLDVYRKYCASKGWQLFTVFVSTPEPVRLERLAERTKNDVLMALRTSDGNMTHLSTQIFRAINTNNKRLKSIIDEERLWSTQARWDVIADGTNVTKALEQIVMGVQWRNSRPEIYA